MSEFFRAHQAVGTTIPTYFIESTAPDNVDDTVTPDVPLPPELKLIDSEQALKEIAECLAVTDDPKLSPNLVVMVHGFNNPEPDVLRMYTAAARAIQADDAIRSRPGLVCVGYRWPSEKMGQPWPGTWAALPTLPTWILYFGLAVIALTFIWFWQAYGFEQWLCELWRYMWNPGGFHLLVLFGWSVAGLILMLVLLRTIVYFRDTYRATNYGVPDLIQIIRAIDGEIVRQRTARGDIGPRRRTVQLSFIGHSMGGFVVTNTIRTLSNLFARQVQALNAYGARSASDAPRGDETLSAIGNVFRLMRFVLASPDIPAEALLSSRGNILASALSRFDEAFLFSNEGDEVLRQISTLANYFVFPTKGRSHGFRLGNVEILSRNFGLIDVLESDFLRVLRIGNLTLQQLYDLLEDAKARRHTPTQPVPAQAALPKVFTYFDCTDYVDHDTGGVLTRPLLTFAKRRKRYDANAKLRWYSHLHLLLSYTCKQRPNVHGGYFEGVLSQQLIYRLACLGYADTIAAYGGEAALSKLCEDKQIRGLISPKLHLRRPAATLAPLPRPTAMRAAPQAGAPASPPSGIGVDIPNLVDLQITEARARIAAVRDIHIGVVALPVQGAGPILVLLEVTKATADKPPGTVLSQTPAAGRRVDKLTTVEVLVAK